ncbi:hypothetical protein SKAU_G00043970 [Synaphobranchus kaupii]|uniref:Uncharacterized protein n=1 Tax=Synaphobranchus kaupii TaxID=118154 RepID=A0A9Q1J936_SYNKA|nr:hypothetical protein SKAU_G00043970 [Synaphobranchus kaupii]
MKWSTVSSCRLKARECCIPACEPIKRITARFPANAFAHGEMCDARSATASCRGNTAGRAGLLRKEEEEEEESRETMSPPSRDGPC